jgi:hypothetical protein
MLIPPSDFIFKAWFGNLSGALCVKALVWSVCASEPFTRAHAACNLKSSVWHFYA